MKIHVYSGNFESEEDAFNFANEMDYEIEDSIPALWESIGADWLDEDFIETIHSTKKIVYLKSLLKDESEIEEIENNCPKEHNTLFLIFSVKDTSNESFEPKKSKQPLYLGSPEANIENT